MGTDQEKQSLDELKKLVQEAIASPSPSDDSNSSNQLQVVHVEDEERIPLLTKIDESSSALQDLYYYGSNDDAVSIWGVPLLKDERTDIILSKFLQDNNFRVKDTLEKIKNTLEWRKLFGIEKLLLELEDDEDLEVDLEEVYYTHGRDKEGRPICYTMVVNRFPYMDFSGTQEKKTSRERFLRSWILSLEKMIRKLVPFLPCQANAILLVNDLVDCHSSWRGELNLLIHLLDEYYPQSIAKQVFVNEPWFATTESKSIFTGESGTLDTLYKYISPERLPVHYGGLSSGFPDDAIPVFTTADPPVMEMTLGAWQSQMCKFVRSQKCLHVWELRRIGASYTSYDVEFVPKSGEPTVVVRANSCVKTVESVVSGYFRASSPGTLVICVDNYCYFSKKKVVVRHKSLPYSQLTRPPSYFICPGTGKLLHRSSS